MSGRTGVTPVMRAHKVLMITMAALLAASSCADGESAGEASIDEPATTVDAGGAADPVVESLAGRYAHFDVVAYEGDAMKTLIISYGFTDLDVVDGELVATESFCFSEHRSDQPITVEMPDVATQAIRPVPIATIVTSEAGRVHVSRPATPTAIGVRLENPATDPLPTDPEDPRVADDDGDGKPGVTVFITVTPEVSGELYIARREIFAYEVDRQPDGTLTGYVDDDSEQLVIGASNPIFLTPAQWKQHPDRGKSPIILEPVERSWDCDRLRAARDEMFPPTPAVDW